MKYYSEDLKKLFDSEEALATAEQEHKDALIAKEKKDQELKKVRADKAEEIEILLKKRHELDKEISEKIDAFVKDYGSFHYSIKSPIGWFDNWFDKFFSW